MFIYGIMFVFKTALMEDIKIQIQKYVSLVLEGVQLVLVL